MYFVKIMEQLKLFSACLVNKQATELLKHFSEPFASDACVVYLRGCVYGVGVCISV